MTHAKSNVKSFQRLSVAVTFITECLEADAYTELFSELEQAQEHVARRSDYLDYFTKFIFFPLCEIHAQTNVRELYQDREFPECDIYFKLGGHMQELGCIHIDFEKRDQGWVLRDIWMCR
jgi:hypothetical protein